MNYSFLHKFIVIFILFFTSFSFAQVIDLEEEKDLKFQEYFFEALKQRAIKNYQKAIESLEKSYELYPENEAVEFEFSKNYFMLKKHFEATFFIDKAITTSPDNIYLLKHKVLILKNQREFEEAIKIQEKIIELNPQLSDELVLLYIQNKNYNLADKLIIDIENKALTTARIKVYKNYLNNIKKSISTKKNKPNNKINNKQSIQELKENYKKAKSYNNLLQLLLKHLEASNFEALYAESKDGLDLFPAQPILYHLNGLALNRLKKFNEAVVVLTTGIDFVIDNNNLKIQFYEQLAIAFEGLKNKTEAEKYKNKIEELRKD